MVRTGDSKRFEGSTESRVRVKTEETEARSYELRHSSELLWMKDEEVSVIEKRRFTRQTSRMPRIGRLGLKEDRGLRRLKLFHLIKRGISFIGGTSQRFLLLGR